MRRGARSRTTGRKRLRRKCGRGISEAGATRTSSSPERPTDIDPWASGTRLLERGRKADMAAAVTLDPRTFVSPRRPQAPRPRAPERLPPNLTRAIADHLCAEETEAG